MLEVRSILQQWGGLVTLHFMFLVVVPEAVIIIVEVDWQVGFGYFE